MQVSNNLKSNKTYATDREQATVRLVNCCVVVIYTYVCYLNQLLSQTVVAIYLYAIPFSLAILAWSIKQPGVNVPRRVLGMLADIGTTTAAMSMSGEAASPLFLIYLWTTFGNGFRYGKNYLYLSMSLSILGFTMVMLLSTYWSEHWYLGGGLLLTLSVLPVYIAALLSRLQAATREAEQASLAKSQFLATMSHEIRTPLNGVVGMSDMLKTTELTGQQLEYANTIQSSAKTLLALIENILDFSKIEAGKTELESVDFDLHEFVHSITRMVYPQAENKGVTCKVHIAADVPYNLHGDSIHLKQVLINLLGNAVKFTEKGYIELDIFALDLDEGRVRLRFEVIDSGIGMTKAEQALIFQNFTQADQSISRRFGGTGLGTTISKMLVEFMGGTLGVVSAPGRGSKFWFELDYAFREAEQDAIDHEPLVSSSASILLVGIAGKRRSRLEKNLKEWGFDWKYANNLDEARHCLQAAIDEARPFDVALVDLLGLGKQGGEKAQADNLAKELARDARAQKSNLVLISPGDLEQSRRTALLSAGYFCILKAPVEKRFLFNALHATSSAQSRTDNVTKLWNFKSRTDSGKKLRILAGEDNETNQRVIRTILEYAGYEVVICTSGDEILNAVEDGEFDLVILDMHMPEIDGIETAKALRFLQTGNRRLPIIMLTADATVNAINASKEADIDFFMTKPIDTGKLLSAIGKLTGHNQASLPLDAPETAEDSKQVLDFRILEQLSRLNARPDFMKELVKGFIADTKKLLIDMRLCIEEQNFDDIQGQAHAIKGSAQNIGAVAIAECAGNIARESRQQHLGRLSDLYGELVEVSGKTIAALNQHLKDSGSASV